MRAENEITESERLRTCWREASHAVAFESQSLMLGLGASE